jgi:hypothetical protein
MYFHPFFSLCSCISLNSLFLCYISLHQASTINPTHMTMHTITFNFHRSPSAWPHLLSNWLIHSACAKRKRDFLWTTVERLY